MGAPALAGPPDNVPVGPPSIDACEAGCLEDAALCLDGVRDDLVVCLAGPDGASVCLPTAKTDKELCVSEAELCLMACDS
jgi:hypothetical protein